MSVNETILFYISCAHDLEVLSIKVINPVQSGLVLQDTCLVQCVEYTAKISDGPDACRHYVNNLSLRTSVYGWWVLATVV